MAPTSDVRNKRERPQGMRIRPITERILESLPGSRGGWIAVWALVPWLNASANVLLDTGGTSAVWEQSEVRVALNYAALSAGVMITVAGTRQIVRELEALLESGAIAAEAATFRSFREIDGTLGPVLLTVVGAAAFGVTAFLRNGWDAALLRGATWLIIGIAFWTFLWTYAGLQVGLNRLGDRRLRVGSGIIDPSLGLRPLGNVAFTGLWLLLAWLIPILLTATTDVVGAVIGLLVLVAGLAAFFLSLMQLHRRMVGVKKNEITLTRELYGEAYAPVREAPALATLQRQADARPERRGRARTARARDPRLADRSGNCGEADHDRDERHRGDPCEDHPQPARPVTAGTPASAGRRLRGGGHRRRTSRTSRSAAKS